MLEPTGRAERRGLLINITGDGKGKTTSGLGTCLRALGWGWQVTVIQFVKSNQDTGEKRFAGQTAMPLRFMTLGAGFSWQPEQSGRSHRDCAAAAFELAADYLVNGKADLLMLDELNIALQKGWLDPAAVIRTLQSRPAWQHVIVTGRGALPELIAASDLVSEIKEIKHPYRAGIAAQQGIDF